ncbi:hypothetical protein [Pseudoflavonifractor sp. 524-17]|uniref:hypothetical protein n=1 Tax=Pseudoflavonifractor sp. 524-17 TaxID=2304577 RepID=UPI001FABA343|nr:hypothetical protein [Pseudoflavonifractor sp. 524-17]
MTAIEIARQLAALGQAKGAIKAYGLVIHESEGNDPAGALEAALYILQNGGDYKVSYSILLDLYRRGQFREDSASIMTQAFYEPNVKLLKSRYQNNCKLLEKYPYLFRKDFLDFEFLPLRFYPYDDSRFVPYDVQEQRFVEYIDVKNPVVSRNFFKDLDRPTFCAYLQCLNMRPLLEDEKFVFLIGEEEAQYPIDFQARFGIDYSQYLVKPLWVWEINKLIWHTQLSSHNGGDFFNEILDAHPNLLALASVMMDSMKDSVHSWREAIHNAKGSKEAAQALLTGNSPQALRVIHELRSFTDLAAFLDIPYTESMTYCSLNGETDPPGVQHQRPGLRPGYRLPHL